MSTCNGAQAEKYAQAYIEGTLAEVEAERFEEHYFDCPRCLEQVEALQAIGAMLARHPIAMAPTRSTRLASWRRFTMVVGAAAAVFVLGFLSLHTFTARAPQPNTVAQLPAPAQPQPSPAGPASPAAPSAAALADLALPAFAAPTLRGEGPESNPESSYDNGMKAYAAGQCSRAIPLLAQVSEESQDLLTARFYLGLCQMHQQQMAQAAATLRGVAAAGDSPVEEAALYYLSQIAIEGNDLPLARRYLARTVRLHGDYEARARAQQHKLAALAQEAGARVNPRQSQ